MLSSEIPHQQILRPNGTSPEYVLSEQTLLRRFQSYDILCINVFVELEFHGRLVAVHR